MDEGKYKPHRPIRKRFKEEHNYLEDDDYDEISLKELVKVIIKGKKTILFIMIALVLLVYAGSFLVPKFMMHTDGEAKTAIKYYYDGIYEGKTPNGDAFDINEIRSPVIIKKVIDELGLEGRGISVDMLRRNISFEEIVPDDVIEELARLKDVKDDELRIAKFDAISYSSNQYIVKLNLDRGMALSLHDGAEVLDRIMRKYQEWFYDTYTYRPLLSNAIDEDFDFSGYDYRQSANILDRQIMLMENYVADKQGSDFRSRVTGLNFSEIKKSISLIRDIELERLYTIIGAFNLTKNPQKAIVLYEDEAESKILEAANKEEEKNMLNNLINSFKRDNTSLLLGDASAQNSLNIKNVNEYYNSLVERYTDAGAVATNASNDAAFLLNEAQMLRTDSIPADLKARATKDAESMITILNKKITFWVGQINVTSDEYYQELFYRKYIEQLTPSQSYVASMGDLKINLAIGLVLGLMLGVFVVFFKEYLKD